MDPTQEEPTADAGEPATGATAEVEEAEEGEDEEGEEEAASEVSVWCSESKVRNSLSPRNSSGDALHLSQFCIFSKFSRNLQFLCPFSTDFCHFL